MDVYCYLKVLLKLHQSVLSDGTQERLRMRSTVILLQIFLKCGMGIWKGSVTGNSTPYQQHGVVNG